ncbi:hypothetical protein cyc_00731 [Cyclospora cayetanensis]|uniref:PITH domain-containing protein n=1 Tax=Cyclospora cayetanensis TaxID=88456 RepID=A0A1D3D486_9EIME|nr:hypothetical protein cyc_00731 [Cyclospora cayetanensis]
MDKTSKETAEANCEKERSLGEDVKKSEVAGNASCSRPSTVLPFGVGASAKKGSEIATLHQILRMKESNLALVSDVDEQLLLNISFKQPIRLAAFSVLASTAPAGFRTDEDDGDSVSAPRLVKVYCNKNTLNFCGVVDEACAFSVLLTPEDVQKERRVTLPELRTQVEARQMAAGCRGSMARRPIPLHVMEQPQPLFPYASQFPLGSIAPRSGWVLAPSVGSVSYVDLEQTNSPGDPVASSTLPIVGHDASELGSTEPQYPAFKGGPVDMWNAATTPQRSRPLSPLSTANNASQALTHPPALETSEKPRWQLNNGLQIIKNSGSRMASVAPQFDLYASSVVPEGASRLQVRSAAALIQRKIWTANLRREKAEDEASMEKVRADGQTEFTSSNATAEFVPRQQNFLQITTEKPREMSIYPASELLSEGYGKMPTSSTTTTSTTGASAIDEGAKPPQAAHATAQATAVTSALHDAADYVKDKSPETGPPTKADGGAEEPAPEEQPGPFYSTSAVTAEDRSMHSEYPNLQHTEIGMGMGEQGGLTTGVIHIGGMRAWEAWEQRGK